MTEGRNRRNHAALEHARTALPAAFTVNDLHAAARLDQPGIGLTTAYRAVHRWHGAGTLIPAGQRDQHTLWVAANDDSDELRLVCRACGAVGGFDPRLLDPLRMIARAVRFQLAEEYLQTLPATCVTCAKTLEVAP